MKSKYFYNYKGRSKSFVIAFVKVLDIIQKF